MEGAKSVLEVLQSDYDIRLLLATSQFLGQNKIAGPFETQVATAAELGSAGTFKTNDAALAVVRMKQHQQVEASEAGWCIMLDDINDPGNFGSVLRIADWYGISGIIASEQTADFYNPKTIAASKGSFCRVTVMYANLEDVLRQSAVPAYAAMMDGEDVHRTAFEKGGILVMGNEANGISDGVARLVDRKITIPRYGGAESLNVAMATAIICDNIKRSQ